MAEQDSFINEVSEEVRRDRLFALLRRYGWIAVLLILLLVGAAGWNEWRKASAQAEAEALGDAILSALEVGDGALQRTALEAIDTGENPGASALVGLLLSGIERQDGQSAAAAARLQAMATDPGLPQLYRDLAALKAVMLAGEDLSPEDRIARLQPLALPGAPYRLLALEQMALAEIARNDGEAALERLGEIVADGQATPSLRLRASQLMVALGGSPEAT